MFYGHKLYLWTLYSETFFLFIITMYISFCLFLALSSLNQLELSVF